MLAKLSSLTILDTAIDTPGIRPPIPSLKQRVESTTAIRRASSSRPNASFGQQPTHSDSRRRRRESSIAHHTAYRRRCVSPLPFPPLPLRHLSRVPTADPSLPPTHPTSPHIKCAAFRSKTPPPHAQLVSPPPPAFTDASASDIQPTNLSLTPACNPLPASRPPPLSPSPLLYSHPPIPRLPDADADAYITSSEKELQGASRPALFLPYHADDTTPPSSSPRPLAALAAAPTDPNAATPPTLTYSLMPPHARFSQLHLQSRPRAPVPAALSLNTVNDVVGAARAN
ncbi:hypothetical protein R3P38DRAFT_3195195 [Favolaschia claudopus]|uniref:Uncharacterized protein n=1 Tax=Favolaschia claudopus TaxID=2862362 RepID=A0AAW0BE33_9AGAR